MGSFLLVEDTPRGMTTMSLGFRWLHGVGWWAERIGMRPIISWVLYSMTWPRLSSLRWVNENRLQWIAVNGLPFQRLRVLSSCVQVNIATSVLKTGCLQPTAALNFQYLHTNSLSSESWGFLDDAPGFADSQMQSWLYVHRYSGLIFIAINLSWNH